MGREQRQRVAAHSPQQLSQTALAVAETMRANGYSPAGALDSGRAIAAAKHLIETRWDVVEKGREKKPFLINVYAPPSGNEPDELIRFALDDDILDAASAYCRFVPLLTSVKVLVSLPEKEATSAKSSQLYHRDNADLPGDHFKLFINVNDVGPTNGPLTFLPGPESDRLSAALNYGGRGVDYRVEDEAVEKHVGLRSAIEMVGPPATAIYIDTSRCFHLGSRVQEGSRWMIMYQYTSACRTRFSTPKSFAKYSDSAMTDRQRMVLGAA